MNFFKSILSDDPDPDPPIAQKPQESESQPVSPKGQSEESHQGNGTVSGQSSRHENASADDNSSGGANTTEGGYGGWSFGGLIKTFATQSESVLETYRRDLQEFGSGLRKETEVIREVASRAVKELPASIEVGASVAQGSLSHALDGVIKSTAEIISQGKETLLSNSDVESETPDTGSRVSRSGRYSRFDAQLSVIQNDANTFCEEPEDSEEYKKWKSGFSLEEKIEEVEKLMGENGALEGVYKRFVPNVVDYETFWCRYFYRVHKLKQQESVRANLVKRAISIDDEEELSWDVDDDDDESELQKYAKSKADDEVEKKPLGDPISSPIAKQQSTDHESHNVSSGTVAEKVEEKHNVGSGAVDEKMEDNQSMGSGAVHEKVEDNQNASSGAINEKLEDKSTGNDIVKSNVVESSEMSASDKKSKPEANSQLENEDKVVEEVEKVSSEGKGDKDESVKASGVSVVSNQQSGHEEDDLGWDEIEDIGSDDEKKLTTITQGGNQDSADLRKRLSAAEEDEDLSWDIEDDA